MGSINLKVFVKIIGERNKNFNSKVALIFSIVNFLLGTR